MKVYTCDEVDALLQAMRDDYRTITDRLQTITDQLQVVVNSITDQIREQDTLKTITKRIGKGGEAIQ